MLVKSTNMESFKIYGKTRSKVNIVANEIAKLVLAIKLKLEANSLYLNIYIYIFKYTTLTF